MTVKQIETATVVGTITLTGNATVTVTALGMGNSPKAISVAVTNLDSASVVGGLIRTALAFDTDVAAMFLVSGTGADVVLTKHVAAANDSTLNIAIANGTCTGLTAAPTSTNTTAGTGLSNAYCTLAELKTPKVLEIAATNTEHDEIFEAVIEGVSRAIDNYCGRRFYAATETRYYTPDNSGFIYVDDIATSAGLTIYTDEGHDGTYENTWATTDYELRPYNATLNGDPITAIDATVLGAYRFPRARKAVKITASFGWASVPKPVNRACVLQSVRLLKRYITPLGQSATSALGVISLTIPALDPDVTMLLRPYERIT